MNKWVKVAEELEARLAAAKSHGPNAIAPDTLRQHNGPIIEGRARPPSQKLGLPAPPVPDHPAPTRFPENGRLLDSQESFLKVGRKGKW